MSRAVRVLCIAPAVAATAVLATVTVKGAITVLELRRFGDTDFPLVAPLNALPAALIVLSFLVSALGRNGVAALLGITALALASVFWLSQASGALG
jgi:uncharacterized membrane protein YfcA